VKHQQLKNRLKKLKPYVPSTLRHLGVEAWRAAELPLTAILERRPIVEAHRVVWPAAEVADFDRFKILGPAADQVLVEAAFTVVSPGTEKAQLSGLPGVLNFDQILSFFPGYSGSGRVIAVGKRASEFRAGDRVAGRLQHGSPGIVQRQCLFRVPDQVSLEQAAFLELGIIVLQGVRKARIWPGESVLVLGQGIIGQLANRLSRLAGAAPVVAAARSRVKAPKSMGEGGADRFLTVDELKREGADGSFDVVIDATGAPSVLPFASSMARAGGRVVGLGTPRGRGRLSLGQDGCLPGLSFIGAHVSGMPRKDQSTGRWTYRDEGRLFLELLAQGELALEGLITHRCDPSQAGEIYESLLAGNSRMIGVVFDWGNLTHSGPTPKRA
jgi:2-desacetyl-2-hydroxyethyl bacteriochlorophyllide A dehydrogenase